MSSPSAQALLALAKGGGRPGVADGLSPNDAAWSGSGRGSWGDVYSQPGTALPRAFDTFRDGQFGPLEPLQPYPIDVREPPGGRPRPRRWCYSEDTEVLTRRGWLTFDQVSYSDEIATRSPDGTFEWQRPRHVLWEPYKGDMVWFHSKTADVLVTPTHGMLHRVRHKGKPYEERISTAEELLALRSDSSLVATSRYDAPRPEQVLLTATKAQTIRTGLSDAVDMVLEMLAAGTDTSAAIQAEARTRGIPHYTLANARRHLGIRCASRGSTSRWGAPTSTFIPQGKGREPLEFEASPEDFAAFMGMYLSEGWTSNAQGEYRIGVSQTQRGKGWNEFRELLVRLLGREPQYAKDAWVFRNKALYEFLTTCGTRAWDKRIPRLILDLPRECLEIFWHYYWLGDGHTYSADRQMIASTSAGMMGDLQEVLQKIGSWGIVRSHKAEHRPIYKIGSRLSKVAQCRKTVVDYNGYIGCVNVPNGVIYVRRNGAPIWSSNTYPVGWNVMVGGPGTEGVMLAGYQVQEDFAEQPTIPRFCIEICRTDILNLIGEDLSENIIPTPSAEKAMQGNPAKRKDFESRKDEIMSFFDNPDPDGHATGFVDWMSQLLEDNIVIDAMAVNIVPTLRKGAGPAGSSLGGLVPISGDMIKPLLDIHGGRPRPPQPAYQQIAWGVPRVDLMDLLADFGPDTKLDDLTELNPILDSLMEEQDQFGADQLLYVVQNRRLRTPYGFSPLAQSLLAASVLVARQTWQLDFYRSGSLPTVFLDPGPSIATAEEARQLQEAINMLGGDISAKHQVIVLPPGSKVQDQKPVDLTSQFDEWLAALMCMAFGLSISDLGLTPKIAAMQSPAASKGAAQTAADRSTKRSTMPRARVFKQMFDRIIQRHLNQQDMMWSWGITEGGESLDSKITQEIELVKGCISSIDESRIRLGWEPLGMPETSVPVLMTPTMIIPLGSDAMANAQASLAPPPEPVAAPVAPPELGGPPKALPPGSAPPKAPAAAKAPPKPAGTQPAKTPAKAPAGASKKPAEAVTPAHAAARTVESGSDHRSSGTNGSTARSKAAMAAVTAECEILRRHLRRGRPLDGFIGKSLSVGALNAGRAVLDDVVTPPVTLA